MKRAPQLPHGRQVLRVYDFEMPVLAALGEGQSIGRAAAILGVTPDLIARVHCAFRARLRKALSRARKNDPRLFQTEAA